MYDPDPAPELDLTPILVRDRSDGLRAATRRALATGLRSALVGPYGRAPHARGLLRRLAPGLFEQVELERGAGATRRVPTREELAPLGLSTDEIFELARRNTLAIPVEVGVRNVPGDGRVFILGAARECDAALAALQLPRILPGHRMPRHGVLLAVPVRGTALWVPLGEDPTDELCRAGVLANASAAPARIDPLAGANEVLRLAGELFRSLPDPVSPHLYWLKKGGTREELTALAVRIEGGVPRLALVSPIREALADLQAS